MAKIDAATVAAWRGMAGQYLASLNPSLTCETVATGREAWNVAHNAGITREAYAISRDVLDSHIQTALEKIFPNAVFRDPKRY